MNYCADTPDKVMKFTDKRILSSLSDLSRKYSNKVTNILRENLVLTDELTEKFMVLTEKESIVVFPKREHFIYKKTFLKNQLNKIDLQNQSNFAFWIASQGVKQSNYILIKYFNMISGSWLKNIKTPIHFDYGETIHFTIDWPVNVTVGRVRQVHLRFTPTTPLPIRENRYVEEVYFNLRGFTSLACLQPFTRLKKLKVTSQTNLSAIMLDLTFLEELDMRNCFIKINIENLRVLSIRNITFDDEVISLISRQSHILVLEIISSSNLHLVQIPETVRSIKWYPIIGENKDLLESHLNEQTKKLKMRMFETNVKLQTIDWLNMQLIETWEFNGVKRKKENGKWVMVISKNFNPNLPYSCCKADVCKVITSDLLALVVIDKSITDLTLECELEGQTEDLPVLNAVTNLTIGYKVNEYQAKLLVRLFPQFTEEELIAKGKEK